MPQIRLCDVPNLPVSQFFDFIKTEPVPRLRELWKTYGPDREEDTDWIIPLTLAGVAVHERILLRINAPVYGQPNEPEEVAWELPGPRRVPEYSRRRAVERPEMTEAEQAAARANGCLGFCLFPKPKPKPDDVEDYAVGQTFPQIATPLVVVCPENGHAVAAAEGIEKRQFLPWTVNRELEQWRERIKPIIWPGGAQVKSPKWLEQLVEWIEETELDLAKLGGGFPADVTVVRGCLCIADDEPNDGPCIMVYPPSAARHWYEGIKDQLDAPDWDGELWEAVGESRPDLRNYRSDCLKVMG